MLVTNTLEKSPSGGRQLLCKLNHDALAQIFGDRLVLFELPQVPLRGAAAALAAFKGRIDGVTSASLSDALRAIRTNEVGLVFVDGSNLGGLVMAIKKNYPTVQVCTFFHNVEARFFLGAFKQFKTPRALAVLLANYLAERKSVRYSDKIICLNQRDSRQLDRLYGRAATHIAPMALQDKLPNDRAAGDGAQGERYALFVGGGFYANRAGIAWYAKNVAPRILFKTIIVGRGLEDLRDQLEATGNVELVGEVASLAPWYLNSHVVIAPIFDGSGMKTKVAEALMFGKKVIGTPEAFSGYEEHAAVAGWVCFSADDFVAAITRAEAELSKPFDEELRALYERNYSFEAARNRLAGILGSAT